MQHKITNMNSTTFKNLTLTEQMLSGELWQESAKKPSGFDQRHSRRHPTPSAHRTIKTPTQSCYPKRPSFFKASTIDCISILRRVLWIIPFRYLKCLNASMYFHVFPLFSANCPMGNKEQSLFSAITYLRHPYLNVKVKVWPPQSKPQITISRFIFTMAEEFYTVLSSNLWLSHSIIPPNWFLFFLCFDQQVAATIWAHGDRSLGIGSQNGRISPAP